MARIGFCYGFYTSQSVNADCQLCMNLYPEAIESGIGKSAMALYGTPGIRSFAILAGIGQIRGTFQITSGSLGQRLFAVGDGNLYEVFADGTYTLLGQVGNDNRPVSWAANNANQLMVCSGGNLYCYPLTAGLTRNVTDTTANVSTIQEAGQIHGATIFITLTAPCPFAVGTQVTLAGCTGIWSWLNGQVYPVQSVGPGLGLLTSNLVFGIGLLGGSNLGPTSESAATVTGAGNIPFTELLQVNAGPRPFSKIRFIDGVFVATVANSQEFQLSNLEDGTNWDQADVGQVEEFPDNVTAMEITGEIAWFFGPTQAIPYQDNGNPLFPYGPIPQVLVEGGIGAPESLTKLDNSLMWISQDDRGWGIAWRMNGYTPTRISTHAIEHRWGQYQTISDAVGYSYQEDGHTFWVLTFPTANYQPPGDEPYQKSASWVYDVATGQWHQRDRWINGQSLAHPGWVHAFCFGKHLIGDPTSGSIYEININFLDNSYAPGTHEPIRRVRRAPHISVEQEYLRYRLLQIYLEAGLGQPTTAGIPSGLPFIPLQDSSGQWWQVSVLDNGQLQSTAVASGVAQVFIFYRADGTYWLLGIEAGTGRITITEVANLGPAYQAINLISPSQFQWSLFPLNTGQLETSLVPLTGEPQLTLRMSRDGGHTWSNERSLDVGKDGEFKRRAIARAMGRARDMVFEITMTGAQPWRIVDAYLKATPAFQATERLPHQLGKIQ